MQRPILLFLLLLSTSILVQAAQGLFQPFTTDSMAEIKQHYKGQPFLISLWSLDCPPCHEELQLLGQLKKTNPDMNLVVVLTDVGDPCHEAQQRILAYGLQKAENWIFADTLVERLRHSIDPDWFGELPRTYFYDVSHQAFGHSGLLTKALLQTWLTSNQLHNEPEQKSPATAQ